MDDQEKKGKVELKNGKSKLVLDIENKIKTGASSNKTEGLKLNLSKKTHPNDGSLDSDDNYNDKSSDPDEFGVESGLNKSSAGSSTRLGGHISKRDMEEMVRNSQRGGVSDIRNHRLSGSMKTAENKSQAERQKKEKMSDRVKRIKEDLRNGAKNKAEKIEKIKNMKKSDIAKGAAKMAAENLRKRVVKDREKAGINAVSIVIVSIAFFVAIVADLIDIAITILSLGTIGSLIAPLTSIIAGSILWGLWWLLGAGDFSGNFVRKNAKRSGWSIFIEAIPVLNNLPTFTIMSILNFLDLIGFWDKNEATREMKKAVRTAIG